MSRGAQPCGKLLHCLSSAVGERISQPLDTLIHLRHRPPTSCAIYRQYVMLRSDSPATYAQLPSSTPNARRIPTPPAISRHHFAPPPPFPRLCHCWK